jgi:hypothetical protein
MKAEKSSYFARSQARSANSEWSMRASMSSSRRANGPTLGFSRGAFSGSARSRILRRRKNRGSLAVNRVFIR